MRLYHRLDGWVREWRVPGDAGGEPEVRGLTAVAITLRHEGQIVGRGADATGGVRSLVLAAGRAMSEANARLPIERDALFDEHVRAAASRITISLELAGTWVPIVPEQWTDAAGELSMGVDGVATRIGERIAAVFPAEMLATGMDPGRGLASAVSRATDDPSLILKKPAELTRDVGAVYYRFRATHLAQPAPGRAPVFLHRGGRVIDLSELDEDGLRRWADALADNLMRRRWPGVERYGVQGTYDPVSGRYEAPFAPPIEQALAIRALTAQWARCSGAPESGRIAAAIRELSDDLEAVEPGEADPFADPAAISIWLTCVGPGMPCSSPQERAGRMRRVLDEAFTLERGFPAGVPPSALGVIAGAVAHADLTRWVRENPEGVRADAPKEAERARAAVTRVFRDTPPGELVSQMPWLGWGALDASAMLAGPGVDPGSIPLPAGVALREMRSLMWRHQLRTESLAASDRDLAGGIVFTASRAPLPSWHAARPLAFAATMLGDPRLTDPSETSREIVRLLASLRFLRQLTAGEAEGHMYADSARAAGGVRIAPWDQRMPVDATAMTLLAVCETLRSLDAIRGSGGLRPGAP